LQNLRGGITDLLITFKPFILSDANKKYKTSRGQTLPKFRLVLITFVFLFRSVTVVSPQIHLTSLTRHMKLYIPGAGNAMFCPPTVRGKMYAYALYGTAVLAHKALFLQLGNRKEWSASCSGRFTSEERIPDTHNRRWVNPRAGLTI